MMGHISSLAQRILRQKAQECDEVDRIQSGAIGDDAWPCPELVGRQYGKRDRSSHA